MAYYLAAHESPVSQFIPGPRGTNTCQGSRSRARESARFSEKFRQKAAGIPVGMDGQVHRGQRPLL